MTEAVADPGPTPGKVAPKEASHETSQKDEAIELESVWKTLTHKYRLLGFSKAMDVDQEEWAEAIKANKTDFKPLVVYLNEAWGKLFEALGYKAKKPKEGSTDGEYDWEVEFHGDKFFDGLAILVKGLATKPKVTTAFFQESKDALHRIVTLPVAERKAQKTAAEKEEEGTEEAIKDSQKEAYVTLACALIKAWTYYKMWMRLICGPDADEPADEVKEEEYNKVELAKGLLGAAIEITTAIYVLMRTTEGRDQISKLGMEIKKAELGTKEVEAQEKLAEKWETARGVSDEKKKENKKKRQDKRVEQAQTAGGKTKLEQIKEFGEKVAKLCEAVVEAVGAFYEIYPADIDGKPTWKVEGMSEKGGVEWTLAATKKHADVFEGKLTAKGRLHPEDRTFRTTDVVEEVKAIVEMIRPGGPHGQPLRMKWKGASEGKLPNCEGEAFFAGKRELEENFDYFSSKLIMGSTAVGVEAGQPKRTIALTRHAEFGDWFNFAAAAAKVLAAAYVLLPKKLRDEIEEKLLDVCLPTIEKVREKLKPITEALEIFKLDLVKEGNPPKYKIVLEFEFPKRIKFAAKWSFFELVQWMAEQFLGEKKEGEGGEKPALEACPLIPEGFELSMQISQRIPEVVLSIERWAGKDKDKSAGATLEKAAEAAQWIGAGDLLIHLQEFQKKHEVILDLPQVECSAGSISDSDPKLPAIKVTLPFYLEKMTVFGNAAEIGAKIAVSLKVTAAQFASVFPAVRACLMAWDVGWSVGTAIRGAYLKTPTGQAFEHNLQGWLAGEQTAWMKEAEEVDGRIRQIYERGQITPVEAYVAYLKSVYYVARKNTPEGQEPAVPHYGPLEDLRAALAGKVDKIKNRGIESEPHDVRYVDPTYMSCAAQGMMVCYLLGSPRWSLNDVENQIDADVKSKALHALTGHFYRLILHPGDKERVDNFLAGKFEPPVVFDGKRLDSHAAWSAYNAAFGKHTTIPADVKEFALLGSLVETDSFRELVEVLNAPLPAAVEKNRVEIGSNVWAGGQWGFRIDRVQANENIRVLLFPRNPDVKKGEEEWDELPVPLKIRRFENIVKGREVHSYVELFEGLKDQLKPLSRSEVVDGKQRKGVSIKIKVEGEGGVYGLGEQPWFFLELDDSGAVKNAFQRSDVK